MSSRSLPVRLSRKARQDFIDIHHKECHHVGKRMAVGQAAEPEISQPKAESLA